MQERQELGRRAMMRTLAPQVGLLLNESRLLYLCC
eukprot:COSAG06_NODE_6073_length_3125_cov_3.821547_2_plen_35_part_00